MIPRHKALKKIRVQCKPVETEEVALTKAAGRILRQAVKTDRPIPPFDRATMDGFAVRAIDFAGRTERTLTVVAEIPAGTAWGGTVARGQCASIMTGAPMPKGTDAVVKVEDSRPAEDGAVCLAPEEVSPGFFVHHRARDARAGKVVSAPGRVLTARDVAAAASVGTTTLSVSRALRVSILNTGREVIRPEATPEPYQIRNANGPGLRALFHTVPWVKARFLGLAPDKPKQLENRLAKALKDCDVLIVTGGVSAGAYDFVPTVLAGLRVQEVFHRVAMRPGKPLWFGRRPEGPLVFGLPGNPVSNFVAAHTYVFPALARLASLADDAHAVLHLPLGAGFRKGHGLEEARIARLITNKAGITTVLPLEYSGSGDFIAAVDAQGLAYFPAKDRSFKAGRAVEFQPWV